MPVTIDPILAVLSIIVAMLGIMSAIALTAQLKDTGLPSWQIQLALANGALTMGAVVWATHFIATRAVGFPASAHNGALEIAALIALTVFATWVGLYLACAQRLGGIGGLLGGLVVGIGIAGMHYRPVRYALSCGVECNSPLMITLVGAVVVVAMVAIWIAFFRRRVWRILVSGVALGLAVALMSYAAMVGTYAVRSAASADWSVPLFLDVPASYAVAGGVAVLSLGNIVLLMQFTKHRLTRERIDLVQWTYRRVEDAGLQVADLFYDRLFEIAPHTRRLFPADLSQQKDKLLDVLASAVLHLHKLDSVLPVVQDLGRRHVYYGVTAEHYKPVGAALIWTLERVLGDDFTPATKRAWIAAYKTLAGAMIASAKGVKLPTRTRIRETAPASPAV